MQRGEIWFASLPDAKGSEPVRTLPKREMTSIDNGLRLVMGL